MTPYDQENPPEGERTQTVCDTVATLANPTVGFRAPTYTFSETERGVALHVMELDTFSGSLFYGPTVYHNN